MRLSFEEWHNRQDFDETSSDLFEEAIVCFKAGAYRAAMLLSYLGFLNVLKSRMLSGPLPNGVTQVQWTAIQNILRDDDHWDGAAFDATQRHQVPIFHISADLRQQVVYWKNRRHDCAHSRANRIGYAHIEAFWLFLTSNLAKFVVNGSRVDLVDSIRRHYDPGLTPPGQDPQPLVDRIPSAVDPAELTAFAAELQQVVFGPKRFLGQPSTEEVAFLGRTLRLNNAAVVAAMTAHVQLDPDLMLGIIREDPALVATLANSAPQVRNLWHDRIFSTYRQDVPVYCALLRNGLIPPAEIHEAHERLIRRWRNEIPTGQCLVDLQTAGFFTDLERIAFDEALIDQFAWANPNASFISWYVETHTLTPTIVSSISSAFTVANHPYQLRDALDALFRANQPKRDEFRAVAAAQRIALPQYIASLN